MIEIYSVALDENTFIIGGREPPKAVLYITLLI